jgi:PPOX class probable F420-dependent enzyme
VTNLSDEVRGFLEEPKLAVAVTLMKDGSPQATPVWIDHDGDRVLINTVEGHQKDRNLQRDRRIALCVVDPDRAGRYLQLRGRVLDLIRGDEALQHIHKLSQKYSGRDYRLREGEQRVKIIIEPLHVSYQPGFGRGESRWTE